jgi:hypothetical protein
MSNWRLRHDPAEKRPPLAICVWFRTFGELVDHGLPFRSGIPAAL